MRVLNARRRCLGASSDGLLPAGGGRGERGRAGPPDGVNTAGLAGPEAAVDLIQQSGVLAIFTHMNGILAAIERPLCERGFQSLPSRDLRQRSCALSLIPPPGVSAVELRCLLASRSVSCSIPEGLMRFTSHQSNDAGRVAH